MASLGRIVETVARALADDPEAVKVTEVEARDSTVVEVTLASGDLGRVIGRNGRTAAAIRMLVSAAAEHDGKQATVDFTAAAQQRV